MRKFAEELQKVWVAEQGETSENAGIDDQPQSANDIAPPRSLEELLGALKCAAANVVLLRKATPAGSASLDAAREMRRAAANLWLAVAGGIQIGITKEERLVLRQHGAEDQLPVHFEQCE
jgi:hypothetical protein